MDGEKLKIGDARLYRPTARKLDILSSDLFSSELLSFLEDGTKLVLDLSKVEFIDSSGLGKIVGAIRAYRDRGGDIRICGAQPTVAVLFDMVRLAKIVGIDQDPETAAAELSKAGGPAGGPA